MRPLERGLYNLALALHKTFNELLDTMTPSEYAGWTVYFEERELERQRAEGRASGMVDFSDPQASQQLIGMVNAAGGGKRAPARGAGHG